MRIKNIAVRNAPPIKNFEISELSDLVVIAGANGAGKTRLVSHVLQSFQNAAIRDVNFTVQATNDDERVLLGAREVVSTDPTQRKKLQTLLQQNRQRRNFRSGILYFESDRSVSQVKPLKFEFEFNDPYTENIGWNMPMQPLRSRWQDTQHAIFKKVLTLRSSLGANAMRARRDGKDQMSLSFSDPLEPFKEAFSKLLSPKLLVDPDLQNQKLMYQEGAEKRPIETLSSGEREVLNIAFDFILRKPSDCVVFFDEPELHLHPELLNRLIKTLRTSGERNQFFLISHSPEVMASSLEDTVVFLTKPKPDNSNQATVLKPGGETTEALSALGQSVGVVALGKKVVLIEGKSSSLDTKVYSAIAQQDFPELIFVPSDSRADLENFDRVNERVLNQTLWGVQFFMLADRDSAVARNEESAKFRTLPRYHLENYFLDSSVLAACFHGQEDPGSWLLDPAQVEAKLVEIASQKISYAAALIASRTLRQEAGNVSLMPNDVHQLEKEQLIAAAVERAENESERIRTVLDNDRVASCFSDAYNTVSDKLSNGSTWKEDIPAKAIFAQFCSAARVPPGRLKNLYIAKTLEQNPEAFKDITDIMLSFSTQ